MKQNEQLPEEGAEQRFDPGEKEQELQDRLQGLSEKKYDEREAGLIEARRQLEMKKITRKKAVNTDLQRALREDSLADLPADSSARAGSTHFMQHCSSCHGLEYDSRARKSRGPPLGLIYGRLSGSDLHYTKYSEGLMHTAELWTSRSLFRWLKDPSKLVSRTNCKFEPLEEDSQVFDLVRFLKDLTLANYSHLRSMKVKPPVAEDYQFRRELEETYQRL